MIAVARRYKFTARHYVEGLALPWSEPHWHDYTVEVVAEAQEPPLGDIVIDTDALDREMDVIVAELEGSTLNETTPTSTTVEALSAWFLERFERNGPVNEVTVWEDDTRWGRARR